MGHSVSRKSSYTISSTTQGRILQRPLLSDSNICHVRCSFTVHPLKKQKDIEVVTKIFLSTVVLELEPKALYKCEVWLEANVGKSICDAWSALRRWQLADKWIERKGKKGHLRFFWPFLAICFSLQILTSDNHHQTLRKKPTRSDIMILKCCFFFLLFFFFFRSSFECFALFFIPFLFILLQYPARMSNRISMRTVLVLLSLLQIQILKMLAKHLTLLVLLLIPKIWRLGIKRWQELSCAFRARKRVNFSRLDPLMFLLFLCVWTSAFFAMCFLNFKFVEGCRSRMFSFWHRFASATTFFFSFLDFCLLIISPSFFF